MRSVTSGATTASEGKLDTRVLLVYSLPGVGVSFLYVMVLVMYLKFATEELGIAPSVIGGIFLVSKVWDAVTDPVAGFLSDRTHSRLGRRRSWILASAPLILLFSVMAWAPPLGLGPALTTAWVAVSVFGFYTAFTIFEVPHVSLGAELTQRHEDRNRVFGLRQGARAVGQLLAFVVGVSVIQRAVDPRSAAGWLISLAAVLTVLSIVWTVWRLPAEREDYAGRGSKNPLKAVRDVWSNQRARILLFVFFIDNLGVGAVGILATFVSEYVVRMPEILPLVLAMYAILAGGTIPIWVWFGNRYEKQTVWRVAMVIAAVGFGSLAFVYEGGAALMVVGFAVAGIGHGCGPVLGQSLKADVIDCDELATGERKEGSYFAAWSLMLKLATGLMIGAVGIALDLAGFVPKAEQTDLVRRTMLFMLGGVPFIAYTIGIVAFARFSLTRAEHLEIRAQLDRRSLEARALDGADPG